MEYFNRDQAFPGQRSIFRVAGAGYTYQEKNQGVV